VASVFRRGSVPEQGGLVKPPTWQVQTHSIGPKTTQGIKPGDAFDDNNPATSDRDDDATEVFLEADFRF
jgi:hypothetical protein